MIRPPAANERHDRSSVLPADGVTPEWGAINSFSPRCFYKTAPAWTDDARGGDYVCLARPLRHSFNVVRGVVGDAKVSFVHEFNQPARQPQLLRAEYLT